LGFVSDSSFTLIAKLVVLQNFLEEQDESLKLRERWGLGLLKCPAPPSAAQKR